METSRTDRSGAMDSVESFRTGAIEGVVGVIAACGAVLARRQDARVVHFATASVIARMTETFVAGRFERDLAFARFTRPVQQTFYIQ